MEQQLIDFHKKHGFPILQRIDDANNCNEKVANELENLGDDLELISRSLNASALSAQADDDERLYRAWLMLEELIEIIQALASNDEVALADGLGDLLYVTIGTAVTYTIPIKAIFDEIHESNMTKKKRDKIRDPRMRDKGDAYVPPNIKSVLTFLPKVVGDKHWKDMTIKELEDECRSHQNIVDNLKIRGKDRQNLIEELCNEIKCRKVANKMNPGSYK